VTEFLGFSFRSSGGRIEVSAKKLSKFKERIKETTRRNRGVSIQRRLP